MVDHLTRSMTLAIGSAFATDGAIQVLAQTLPGIGDNMIMQLAEKGGGWVVLLIVLWVYRRDYKRLSEGETDRVNQLIALHVQSAKTNQDVAVALSRNTEVLRMVAAKQNGHEYNPEERRRDDHVT